MVITGTRIEACIDCMKPFGLVFDIDGVLIRGKKALPGAAWALQTLERKGIPYALLTNGGGILEAKKKESVCATLGIPDLKGHVILSHTPMKDLLVEEYRDKRCLILGCREEISVAKSYGFQKIISPQQLAAQHPSAYENWGRILKAEPDPFQLEPIEAIIIMHDPIDYHLELQICVDVLRGRYPRVSRDTFKQPKIYNSNDDLEFSSHFPYPRLAQGVFLHCLELIHNKCPNALGPLEIIRYGKPHSITFKYCERQLGQSPKRFYMIGDNPAADIRGANNAGEHWTSVLVKTGVFPSSEINSVHDPADIVANDVKRAIEIIFQLEGETID